MEGLVELSLKISPTPPVFIVSTREAIYCFESLEIHFNVKCDATFVDEHLC